MELEYAQAEQLHKQNETENATIAPHSCHLCRQLWIDLRKDSPDTRETYVTSIDLQKERRFNVNTGLYLVDLLNGALQGCEFFIKAVHHNSYLILILGRMQKPLSSSEFDENSPSLQLEFNVPEAIPGHYPSWLPPDKQHMARDVPSHGKFLAHDRIEWQVTWKYGQSLLLELSIRPFKFGPDVWGGNINIGRYDGFDISDEGNLDPTGDQPLPPNLVPYSNLTFTRARAWLDTCEHSHTSCLTNLASYRPKRLLGISEDGEFVTLESDYPSSCYATLSYCWGGDQPFKNTRSRFDEYRRPLATMALPATIRDAVRSTYGLGLHYIWVDSICIVQDDAKDMQEQLGEMHSIYRGSSVTIVASRAANSTEGFLQLRTEQKPFALPLRYDGNDASHLLLSPALNGSHIDPIFRRGWTFQELRLSTRMLAFGKYNCEFFCLQSHHSDGGLVPLLERSGCSHTDHIYEKASSVPQRPRAFNGLSPGSVDIENYRHPWAWTMLLQIYLGRELSIPTDRLPALGALAQEYAVRNGMSKYYAGLWEEDFLWQLLWYTNGSYKREDQYCGPTWSWCASPLTHISHPTSPPAKYNMTCTILSISIDLLSTSNPYGGLKAAELTLRGRTRAIIWATRTEQEDDEILRLVRRYGLRGPGVGERRPAFDVTGRFVKGQTLSCHIEEELHCAPGSETPLLAIEIGHTTLGNDIDWDTRDRNAYNDSFAIEPQGLVLQEIGKRGSQTLYKRVGSLVMRSNRLFQSPEVMEKEVVIV